MDSRVIDEPRFAAETEEFLARLGPGGELDLAALRLDRASPPDPALSGVPDPAVRVADLHLPARGGPVPVRVYRSATATGTQPLLLWLHGGGFIGGSVIDLDLPCSLLAMLAGVTVVSLEYRLAPEHPFPAALHDTYDAMCWLTGNGWLLGGDGRLAAGGQSAGANLVAGACLLSRDRAASHGATGLHSGPRIDRQVLCYPVLDFGRDTESFRLFDGVFLSIAPGQPQDDWYLAGLPVTGYAAPLRAADLADVPPALIIGAGRDPLRDHAREYAARLDAAAVPVKYVEYAETMHAFLNFCPHLSAGRHAVTEIAADLTELWALPARSTGMPG